MPTDLCKSCSENPADDGSSECSNCIAITNLVAELYVGDSFSITPDLAWDVLCGYYTILHFEFGHIICEPHLEITKSTLHLIRRKNKLVIYFKGDEATRWSQASSTPQGTETEIGSKYLWTVAA